MCTVRDGILVGGYRAFGCIAGIVEFNIALKTPLLFEVLQEVPLHKAGATIDIPLGHKDEPWSFDHFDTLSVSVADAPRPDEIVMFVAIAAGGKIEAGRQVDKDHG